MKWGDFERGYRQGIRDAAIVGVSVAVWLVVLAIVIWLEKG